MNTIKGIWGAEPNRESEFPETYLVGHGGVTKIAPREQNLGDYGIVWFDVFKGSSLSTSMNARFVASVTYFDGVS